MGLRLDAASGHRRCRGWIPQTAELSRANRADSEEAPALLRRLPADVRFVRLDVQYDDPTLHEACAADGWVLVTSNRGPYPHTDDGIQVSRVFHELRSRALETSTANSMRSSVDWTNSQTGG